MNEIVLGQYLVIPKSIRIQVMLLSAPVQNLAEVNKKILRVKKNLN